MADLFKLQDQIVAQLANNLGWVLTKAEIEKGARSASPDAMDLSLRGSLTRRSSGISAVRPSNDRPLGSEPNSA
jgi:hypothetical protein